MQGNIQQRVHIISRSGNWAMKKEGASRALKIFQTKEDAIIASYPFLLMGYDLVIHRKDGSVEQLKRADSLGDTSTSLPHLGSKLYGAQAAFGKKGAKPAVASHLRRKN